MLERMAPSLDRVFLRFSADKLRQLMSRIEVCASKLDDDQIWMRGNESSNSIGNLCLHLAGNVRQWLLHGVRGDEDLRNRDGEFNAAGGLDKAALITRLSSTVDEAIALIESLPATRLLETVTPQTYEVTVMEAVYHVVEHFAQHTAQIIYVTKALTGEETGFYKHLKGTTTVPETPAGAALP